MKNITIGLITHKNSKYKLNNFKPIFNLVKRNNRQIQLVIEDEDKITKLKINVLRATLFHYKFLRVQYRWFKFILPPDKKMHYCLTYYLSLFKKITIFIILYSINPKFRENEIKNWKKGGKRHTRKAKRHGKRKQSYRRRR